MFYLFQDVNTFSNNNLSTDVDLKSKIRLALCQCQWDSRRSSWLAWFETVLA